MRPDGRPRLAPPLSRGPKQPRHPRVVRGRGVGGDLKAGGELEAGRELVVELTAMDTTGPAVGFAGAERVLVPGAIPGERARVRLVRALGRSMLAEIVTVEQPSPARIVPRCRHASTCGGCGWQHIAYPEQLRLKRGILETLLREAFPDGAPRVEPMIGMPVGPDGQPWGFRHKAAFVFGPGPGRGGLTMGHFARGSNDVVPIEECPVHSARANRIAFALRDELARAHIGPAVPGRGGLARHLVVRTSCDEREAVAMLVATRNDSALDKPLQRFLASPEKPDGLLVNVHDRPGPYLVGRETLRVAGSGHVREERLGPSFLVSPTAFFQTNVMAAEVLLRLVRQALPAKTGLRVLDLYSGSGLFALPLARDGHRVTAVEDSRKATRDAALNGRINGVPEARLRLVCSKVEAALPHLARERFDAVILDPPRQGCPTEVLRGVFAGLGAARVILVSCNPEALARELPVATAAGYRVERVQPVDMFPHTPHIETVAVLVRSRASEPAPKPRRQDATRPRSPRGGRRGAASPRRPDRA